MTKIARAIPVLLLALLIPLQATAAACLQVCLQVHHESPSLDAKRGTAVAGDDGHGSGHCDTGNPAGHKCCAAHTFLLSALVLPAGVADAQREPAAPDARWKNFIPEEPSPPPIAASSIA